MTKLLAAVSGIAAGLAGGCVTPQNDRMTVGQSYRPEALSTPRPPSEPSPSDQVVKPSVTGVSRAEWQATQVVVPVDGTVHPPTYAKRLRDTDKTRRQRGQSPTVVSALELSNGSEEQQDWEALGNVGLAVTDVFLILPRMIFDPPSRLRVSPEVGYERYWRPERWEAEPDSEPPAQGPLVIPQPGRVTP